MSFARHAEARWQILHPAIALGDPDLVDDLLLSRVRRIREHELKEHRTRRGLRQREASAQAELLAVVERSDERAHHCLSDEAATARVATFEACVIGTFAWPLASAAIARNDGSEWRAPEIRRA